MAKMVYMGFDENNYTDSNNVEHKGFNIFLAEPISTGIRPVLRYNSSTKIRSFYRVSDTVFRQFGLAQVVKYPSPCEVFFDRYGNIDSITF